MRVRNLDTKGNTLAAAFTFSHGTCTSCSEVRNQNNQLDYCSRLPGKMQAFFQKILRFFAGDLCAGQKNSIIYGILKKGRNIE
jgi:hypothetical protein